MRVTGGGRAGRDARACDAVAEEREQLGVALRLHRVVPLVRGGGQGDGDAVAVQVPQQPLRACTR